MIDVEYNIKTVRNNIAEACVKCGRDPEEVTLMAVSKMQPDERVAAAAACGQKLFGENLVQEIVRKTPMFRDLGVMCQLIGHLQTNKGKYLPGITDMIQSVDSPKLAREISRRYTEHGMTAGILIEVNIGGEMSKSGVEPALADELCAEASELPGVVVRGVMCVPPAVSGEQVREYFAATRRIFDDLRSKGYPGTQIDILSMGMSGDYIYAIEEGSTLVRVGSGIFGARDYSKK